MLQLYLNLYSLYSYCQGNPIKVIFSCLGPNWPLKIELLFLLKKKNWRQKLKIAAWSPDHIFCSKEISGLSEFINISSTFADILSVKFK